MTKAIRIHDYGGPEKMVWEDVTLAPPGPGEVRLRNKAVGLNFIDTYHRTGLYKVGDLPHALGLEGAGVVEAVGDGVSEVSPGDRVAYNSAPIGAYAEERNYPANRLVKLPPQISDQQAAAMMLQGMTAEYLIRRVFHVKQHHKILIHAAAGGVGLILTQWAKHLGATVIGTAGSKEKADLAKQHGADHVILYREESFKDRVREITDGQGVDVVYDGVGKDVFMDSLDCLRKRGMMATFGNASGPPPSIEPITLSQKGSLFLTRPILAHYTETRADLLESAEALFAVVASGAVKIEVNQTYPLREAAQAHRDLEARKTTGSTVLLP